jgi:hypothetical protein
MVAMMVRCIFWSNAPMGDQTSMTLIATAKWRKILSAFLWNLMGFPIIYDLVLANQILKMLNSIIMV